MRIEENAIFGAYMDSLITEAKKGKNLPPWLKDKKGEKEEKSEDGEKKEKKDKKGKKGKGLPPWLKKKGKKVVKEGVEDSNPAADSESSAGDADEAAVVSKLDEQGYSIADLVSFIHTTAPEAYDQLKEVLGMSEGVTDSDDNQEWTDDTSYQGDEIDPGNRG